MNKYLTPNVIIAIYVITILCVCVSVFLFFKYYLFKDKFTQSTPVQKTLKYFGSPNCPYSDNKSIAYNTIKQFMTFYPDVQVNFYTMPDNENVFKENNIEYVPTILNTQNQPIELRLPADTKTDGKSIDELTKILMDNIYASL
jgi:hypothetical protein